MGFLLDPHVFAPTPPLPPSLGSPVKCQKFPQGIQVCAIPSFVQLSIPTVARVPYGPPSHAHCTCHLVKPVVPAAQRGHSLQNFLSPPNSISPSPDALHVSGHRVLSLVDRKGWCRPPPPRLFPIPLAPCSRDPPHWGSLVRPMAAEGAVGSGLPSAPRCPIILLESPHHWIGGPCHYPLEAPARGVRAPCHFPSSDGTPPAGRRSGQEADRKSVV